MGKGKKVNGWKCVLCRLARHNTTNKICQYFCHNENYTYLTSINMSKTTKVTFQLHLYPFDVAFSKIQTECKCVTYLVADQWLSYSIIVTGMLLSRNANFQCFLLMKIVVCKIIIMHTNTFFSENAQSEKQILMY